MEGGPAIMKRKDSCVCRGKGLVTHMGKGMTVGQNETHCECGYENDRHSVASEERGM